MSQAKWPIILTKELMSHVNLSSELGLLYMMNPKAACSSVKQSLWHHSDKLNGTKTYPGNPHAARDRAPFRYAGEAPNIYPDFMEKLHDSVVFTVVRNPYVRALSAYLDRVIRAEREKLLLPFLQSFGLDLDARPSFIEVLNLLRLENPYLLDRHFAPQWVNVFADGVTFEKIFHVEEPGALDDFLVSYGVESTRFNMHATNALDFLNDYYGPAEIDAVAQVYRLDFELFGYNRDIRSLGPARPVLTNRAEFSVLEDAVVLFAKAPRAEKEKRLSQISEKAPTIDGAYLSLTAIGMSFEEKLRAARELSDQGSANWRYASQLGADLARAGALDAAMPVLEIARAIQKNRAVPGILSGDLGASRSPGMA